MKRTLSISALLLVLACGSGAAWADHWHGRGRAHIYGSVVIDPFWGPWYPPGPYYYPPYYPPVVAAPSAPPVYVEQGGGDASPPASQQAYWYYCRTSNSYYPYVKDCPEGWLKVSPQPSDQR